MNALISNMMDAGILSPFEFLSDEKGVLGASARLR